MARNYKSLQEQKNLRRAYFFVGLTVVIGLLLFIFGLPLVIKFAGFLSNLRQSSNPIEISDTTPPAPPRFDNLPEFTNSSSIAVSGTAEAGSSLKLYLNGKPQELVVGTDGTFNVSFPLKSGTNSVYGETTDTAGNKSKETETYTITFDNDKPALSVTSPKDGDHFYGAADRQVTIEGTSEQKAKVTVNDRIVAVENDGSFSYVTTLPEGSTQFKIVATDQAGNETDLTITLNYTL